MTVVLTQLVPPFVDRAIAIPAGSEELAFVHPVTQHPGKNWVPSRTVPSVAAAIDGEA